MSDAPLPVYVDARKVFVNETLVEGSIEVQKLERVAACTADGQGKVRAKLTFSIDRAGRRRIKGSAQSPLMLTCQRCLQPVAVELQEEIELVLVDDEESAQLLDKEFEPWVSEDHRIILADLLDEQLLLGMPIVVYHQHGPCSEKVNHQTGEQDAEAQTQELTRQNNPFAVLADFKVERD
jgi:uncharacterized protein